MVLLQIVTSLPVDVRRNTEGATSQEPDKVISHQRAESKQSVLVYTLVGERVNVYWVMFAVDVHARYKPEVPAGLG